MNPLYIFAAFLLVVLLFSSGYQASVYDPPTVTVYTVGVPNELSDPVYVYRHQDDGDKQWYIEDKEILGYPHANPVRLIQTSRTFEIAVCCHEIADTYTTEDVTGYCTLIPMSTIAQNPGGSFSVTIPDCGIPDEPDIPDIPEPELPEPTNLLQMIINTISAWISSIISWLLPSATIAGAETIQLGQSITANVELSVPAPDSSYADGTTSMHYGVAFVSDSNGNVVWNTEQTVVTGTSYTSTVSYTPTTHGSYVIGAIVAETTANFNLNTGTWEPWTDPVIIAEDTLVVTVTGAPVPPPPPSFNLLSLIQSLIDWIKSLFGVS